MGYRQTLLTDALRRLGPVLKLEGVSVATVFDAGANDNWYVAERRLLQVPLDDLLVLEEIGVRLDGALNIHERGLVVDRERFNASLSFKVPLSIKDGLERFTTMCPAGTTLMNGSTVRAQSALRVVAAFALEDQGIDVSTIRRRIRLLTPPPLATTQARRSSPVAVRPKPTARPRTIFR